MNQTIQNKYSCIECGLSDTCCEVTARSEEDVLVWMDYLILAIAYNHSMRSPHCPAKSITDIKIPISGADKIGGVAIQ